MTTATDQKAKFRRLGEMILHHRIASRAAASYMTNTMTCRNRRAGRYKKVDVVTPYIGLINERSSSSSRRSASTW